MTNRNERMEKLTNAGIEVGKYFTLEVPEGLDAGTKIHIVFDESGVPQFANGNENDVILNQIIEDGYVRNTKLHRRFVMAQMFHHLNYISYNGRETGYNACIRNCYGYKYTIDMMIEEVRVLSKLEVKDKESFEERVHFFDKNTVAAVLEDYLVELIAYVDKLPKKNCKGVPYKRVKNKNIFEADLEKKLYAPVKHYIRQIKIARDYKAVYNILCRFKRDMVKLPWNTKKSKVWLDAYKGEGAYYTMRNLLLFNGCDLFDNNGNILCMDSISKDRYLKSKLDEYKGEGWRMFALMKKVIKDNDFDFNERMREVYGGKSN